MAPSYLGEFTLRGAELRKKGINRIGNLLVPNNNYCQLEEWILPVWDKMLEEQNTQVPEIFSLNLLSSWYPELVWLVSCILMWQPDVLGLIGSPTFLVHGVPQVHFGYWRLHGSWPLKTMWFKDYMQHEFEGGLSDEQAEIQVFRSIKE